MKSIDSITPKAKLNYIVGNRSWTMIKRHIPIVLKPLLAGIILAALWRYGLHNSSIHFAETAKEPILFIVLPLVAFIYVIFAGIAVTSVFDQYKIISQCVVKKDLDTFLLYRDEQLPIMMHILVGAPSIIIIMFVMLFDYGSDTLVPMAAIIAVTFVLLLIWVIATELDDFSRSIWFREKIPATWYEIDVEQHFNGRH